MFKQVTKVLGETVRKQLLKQGQVNLRLCWSDESRLPHALSRIAKVEYCRMPCQRPNPHKMQPKLSAVVNHDQSNRHNSRLLRMMPLHCCTVMAAPDQKQTSQKSDKVKSQSQKILEHCSCRGETLLFAAGPRTVLVICGLRSGLACQAAVMSGRLCWWSGLVVVVVSCCSRYT